ncbi:MAG: dienelactone hydrolase family protein [Fuerstiella sp.]
MKSPSRLLTILIVLATALHTTSVQALDARRSAYAKLITGKFAHAKTPIANDGLPLWLFAPKKLASGKKKYPLLICLHGRRNKAKPGDVFRPQAIATPWTKPNVQKANPCFVVQPYYPPKGGWEKIPEQLDATITHLVNNLPIDPQRIYLLGFSNGGQGTFQTLARQPHTYAAAITISGPVPAKPLLGKIKAPIRSWVGENDNDLNKRKRCISLAKALRADGVDIELKVVAGAGHSCHGVATSDPEVRDWLFNQKLIKSQ